MHSQAQANTWMNILINMFLFIFVVVQLHLSYLLNVLNSIEVGCTSTLCNVHDAFGMQAPFHMHIQQIILFCGTYGVSTLLRQQTEHTCNLILTTVCAITTRHSLSPSFYHIHSCNKSANIQFVLCVWQRIWYEIWEKKIIFIAIKSVCTRISCDGITLLEILTSDFPVSVALFNPSAKLHLEHIIRRWHILHKLTQLFLGKIINRDFNSLWFSENFYHRSVGGTEKVFWFVSVAHLIQHFSVQKPFSL